MLYPDFKARYAILAAAELNSSSDNKTAVYALMDKIELGRERYRLGHTLVFFRAGALAFLEEKRDDIVIKLLRMIQGQVYKHMKRNEIRGSSSRLPSATSENIWLLETGDGL